MKKRLGLNSKIIDRIVIADIADDFSNQFFVCRHFTALDHTAEVVTENASEIMMARIGEQGTAVREHADEGCDMTRRREVLEVLFHSRFVVKEPPRGTVLDLSARLCTLETTDERHDLRVHLRIQIENDGFR